MQRDFLGLAVEQETSQEPDYDPAPLRTSQLQTQWPFSKKDSFSSSLLSFGSPQKNIVNQNDSEVPYSTTNYPTNKLEAYPFHRSMVNQTNLTMSPAAIPAMASHGPVDLRKASKNSQLTIFYNGSVCVYENIAPEKAQAIMLLAGNGPPAPIQAPVPVMNSISASPSGANFAKIVEPQNVVSSLRAAPFSPDAVPQFRRRSLARFMERRKERSVAANPYGSCSKP